MNKPVLVTLTAPSCAGKSWLLNHIRAIGKYPCLVSTTTRAPRAGEEEGVDYFFISEERSKEIEENDGFAELAMYNGIRYGVTKEEFKNKLDEGIAFLIVEPTGIDHYVKPALDIGAVHLSYFIEVPDEVRYYRFKCRINKDLRNEVKKALDTVEILARQSTDKVAFGYGHTKVKSIIDASAVRLEAMMTKETKWKDMHAWTRVLSGLETAEANLDIIISDVKNIKEIK